MSVPLAKITSVSDPYKPYKAASPKIIHNPGEHPDVIVYNVTTNFQAIDKAHKASLIDPKEVKSSYARYIPDVGKLPGPGAPFDEKERQRIINEGVIPEVLPFMAGARIALAEWQADRQHRKAQRFSRRAHTSHNTNVALKAAGYVVENGDYTDPENEFPPTTLPDLAVAKRMGRLIRRARHFNQLANAVEYMYTPPGETQADFDGDPERQSIFEQFQRMSSRNLHNRRVEKANRQLIGRRIPVVDKRIGLLSFDSLAAGGPGSPLWKANRALKNRDRHVLKAEALRQAQDGLPHSLLGMDKKDPMTKKISRVLGYAIQEHGKDAILSMADLYRNNYIDSVQALNMDPAAVGLDHKEMLRYLATERYMLQHPKKSGPSYEGVNRTDPFTADRDKGLVKRQEIIDRLVGTQFIASAVKPEGDDFAIDHAYIGSLTAVPDDERAVLEAALQCRRDMKAGRPVRLTALAAIGQAYRQAADLLRS